MAKTATKAKADAEHGDDLRKNGTQCIHRSMGILRLLAGAPADGMKLIDIAAALELPHPTAHRILKALEEEGIVSRVRSTRRYIIGAEAAWLGLPAVQRFPIASISAPTLDRLSDSVGDSVFLAVRSLYDSVYVDRRFGSYPIQATRLSLGARRPLGVTVASRAMMGFMGTAKTQDILARNRSLYSIYRLDEETVIEDAARARKQGWLFAGSLTNRERAVLSAPILDLVGAPIAAISVIGSLNRLRSTRIERIAPMLKAAVREISENLLSSNAQQFVA